MSQKQTKFSRWGFILSAVGSAVGMANVWGFPAKMGANGGGAFLVAYLIFVALFSAVGLSAEYAMGRRARTGTLGASKLAPYAEQIKEWQAKGMTLREIAAELKKYGCITTAQNISLFLRKKK